MARKAIVYLRQSSDKQVRQNKESQRLQYELADRMRAMGWREVEVISSDLGLMRQSLLLVERDSSAFSVRWR